MTASVTIRNSSVQTARKKIEADVRITTSENKGPFTNQETKVRVRMWRGLEIRTPYFAAADFPTDRTKPHTLKETRASEKEQEKPEKVDIRGMLQALRVYGI